MSRISKEPKSLVLSTKQMLDIKDEFLAFFSKIWALLFYIFIGIMAKFSFNLVQGKKTTWPQVLGTTGISLFVGFIASVICMHNYPQSAPYVVPIATLSADKIMTVLLTINWRKIILFFIKEDSTK